MPIFRRELILTISDQLVLDCNKLMHRVNYQTCPVTVGNLFTQCSGTYGTRFNLGTIEAHRSMKYNKSFLCKAVTEWGKCPVKLKVVENINNFTSHLKNHLISKY